MAGFASKTDKRNSALNRIGLKTKRPAIEMAGRKLLRLIAPRSYFVAAVNSSSTYSQFTR